MLVKAESDELENSNEKLQVEKHRLEADVTRLNYQANYLKAEVESRSIQLRKTIDATAEAELVRQATINQTAKMLGMNDYETIDLRMNKQFELIQATFEAKTMQILRALLTS